ncbi:hypothetical protein MMC28_004432 [Mycoblastus sanguinarius]|nr:hypothetical protein [Mycoblastus sanguinarius]
MDLHPPGFIPLSTRPNSFPPGESASLKRKWAERSSSSYDWAIAKQDEFRAGFPAPLPTLFVEMTSFRPDDPIRKRWEECQDYAKDICEDDELEYREISIWMIRGAGEITYHRTLIIALPDETRNDEWRQILITIGRMLWCQKSLDLHATIVGPHGFRGHQAFMVPSNHAIVKLWPGESL